MKSLVAAFILAVIAVSTSARTAKEIGSRSRAETIASIDENANKVVDAVIELLRNYALEHNLDPMSLPDMTEDFQVDLWVTTIDCTLYLTNGWLLDLTSMLRSGDASLEINGNLVHIKTTVEFSVLKLNYDYRVVFLGTEPTGLVKGNAEGLKVAVDLNADLNTYTTTLGSLSVLEAGNITIKFEDSNGIDEGILDAIADLVEPYFQDDILKFVEDKMSSSLADALVGFDIRDIIG